MYLKRKVYNQGVLPLLTYGAKTLYLTEQMINKVRLAQKAMLVQSLRERVSNTEIRRRSGVTDAITSLK